MYGYSIHVKIARSHGTKKKCAPLCVHLKCSSIGSTYTAKLQQYYGSSLPQITTVLRNGYTKRVDGMNFFDDYYYMEKVLIKIRREKIIEIHVFVFFSSLVLDNKNCLSNFETVAQLYMLLDACN